MSSHLRKLGLHGPEVSSIALGCEALSRHASPEGDAESIATIHKALEGGVNLLDTADFYGGGRNELLIGKAIHDRRDAAVLSVKFGGLRSPDGRFVGLDARPAAVKNFVTYSLVRLGVDYIDIYRPARLDPTVPIEDTVGAIGDLVKAGYVRYVGLSEVGPDTIRRAHATHPISDLQIEYSLMSRGPEDEIFPLLRELEIGVTAYGVLSHGLLSGSARKAPERAHLPRLQGDNFEHNLQLVSSLSEIAKGKAVTNSQLAIAWVLAKGWSYVPVVGSKRASQVEEALSAAQIQLSNEDVRRLEQAIPPDAVAGARYAEPLMRMLDSEKRR